MLRIQHDQCFDAFVSHVQIHACVYVQLVFSTFLSHVCAMNLYDCAAVCIQVVAEYTPKNKPPFAEAQKGKPIAYNGGVIYVSWPRKCFRCIRTKSKFETEKPIPWGGEEPTAAALEKALKCIDEYRA